MGQYHKLLNFTKREYVNPRGLGDGAKLMEQIGGPAGSTADALHYLLAASNGRGGGDYPSSEFVGRWAGDVVAMVGDYAESTDVPGFNAEEAYHALYPEDDDEDEPKAKREEWTDITAPLRIALSEAMEIVYGQFQRLPLHSIISGWEYSHRTGDGRVGRIGDRDYPIPDLLRAASSALSGRRLGPGETLSLDDLKARGLGAGVAWGAR